MGNTVKLLSVLVQYVLMWIVYKITEAKSMYGGAWSATRDLWKLDDGLLKLHRGRWQWYQDSWESDNGQWQSNRGRWMIDTDHWNLDDGRWKFNRRGWESVHDRWDSDRAHWNFKRLRDFDSSQDRSDSVVSPLRTREMNQDDWMSYRSPVWMMHPGRWRLGGNRRRMYKLGHWMSARGRRFSRQGWWRLGARTGQCRCPRMCASLKARRGRCYTKARRLRMRHCCGRHRRKLKD